MPLMYRGSAVDEVHLDRSSGTRKRVFDRHRRVETGLLGYDTPLRHCAELSHAEYSYGELTVPKCSPPLANLAEMVRQLNSDREFFGFIKRGK